MGRPLNKKFFGGRNIGSTTTTADDKIGGSAVGPVAVSGTFSGCLLYTSPSPRDV
jgi:hypothetical protein